MGENGLIYPGSYNIVPDNESGDIRKPGIGDTAWTYVTPGDPLLNVAKGLHKIYGWSFLESGVIDTSHPSYPSGGKTDDADPATSQVLASGALAPSDDRIIAYRIIRAHNFDGVNVQMKRFTPNDDIWCGEGLLGDLFTTDTLNRKRDHYFNAIQFNHREPIKCESDHDSGGSFDPTAWRVKDWRVNDE